MCTVESSSDTALPAVKAETLFRIPAIARYEKSVRQAILLLLFAIGFIALAAAINSKHTFMMAAVPIGLFAAWRYLWWINHLIRAVIYLKWYFPKLRHHSETSNNRQIERLYVVVASYNIPHLHFTAVYRALFENAVASGVPVTIIASITSHRDRFNLMDVFESIGAPSRLNVIAQLQKGDGKRSAIGMALRLIARQCIEANALTVLMDGDIVLEPDALRRSIQFFRADPELAALTTNNDAIVEGSRLTADWYALRHAQRHLLMSSLSLSSRLLVLTGRFSIYRTTETISPAFIDIVEHDAIHNWRLGRIELLSGDDKSIWFHLLRQGGKMMYVPDVTAYGIESLPKETSFVTGTTRLMTRWFGNMLRTNGRAVALGPVKVTPFLWWCLLDQRLSIWTALVGPTFAVMTALTFGATHLLMFLAWAGVTRCIMSLALWQIWGRCRLSWPILMIWNQVWGAAIKGWIVNRIDRQSWTRQGIKTELSSSKLVYLSSDMIYAASIVTFIIFMMIMSGTLNLNWPTGVPK